MWRPTLVDLGHRFTSSAHEGRRGIVGEMYSRVCTAAVSWAWQGHLSTSLSHSLSSAVGCLSTRAPESADAGRLPQPPPEAHMAAAH